MKTKEKVISYLKNQFIKDLIVSLVGVWLLVQFFFEKDWAWKILVVDGILFFLFAFPFYVKEAEKNHESVWRYILTTAALIALFAGMIALFVDVSWAIVLIGAGILLYFVCWVTSPIKIKIK